MLKLFAIVCCLFLVTLSNASCSDIQERRACFNAPLCLWKTTNRTAVEGNFCKDRFNNCTEDDYKAVVKIGTVKKIDIQKAAYFNAFGSLRVCAKDLSSLMRFEWTITATDDSQPNQDTLRKPRLAGRVAYIPPRYLVTGKTYEVFVNATATFRGVTYTANATQVVSTFTIPPQLRIVGGSKRNYDANRTVRFQAKALNPSALAGMDRSAFKWDCVECSCDNQQSAECKFKQQLQAANTFVVTAPPPLPEGLFTVVFQAGDDENFAAVQRVEFVKKAVPLVQILNTLSKPSANRPLAFYASVRPSNAPEAALSITMEWFLNGVAIPDSNRRSLLLPATNLTAGENTTIRVVAMTTTESAQPKTLVGYSQLRFKPSAPVQGLTCQVAISPDDASHDENNDVVALSTKLRLQTNIGSSEDSEELEYAFSVRGFQSNTLPLSGRYLSSSFFDFIAPQTNRLQYPAQRDVTFVVVARPVGNRNLRTTAQCAISIFGRQKNATTAFQDEEDALEAAASNNETEVVLRAAVSASFLLDDQESSTAAISRTKKVVTTLANTMDRENKANGKLAASVRNDALNLLQHISKNATLIGSDDVEGEDGKETRKSMITMLKTIFERRSSDSDDDGGEDGEEEDEVDAETGLQILKTLIATRTEGAASTAVEMAKFTARRSTLGETQRIRAEGLVIAALRKGALDAAGSNVTAEASSMKLPASYTAGPNATATSELAISASEMDVEDGEKIFPKTGLAGGDAQKMASTVVDFSLQLDGEDLLTEGLSDPIVITLTVTKAAAIRTENLTCVYFKESTRSWSTDGVTTVRYDAATQVLTCTTTHLSTFTSFAEADSAATAEPTTTDSTGTPAPSDTAAPDTTAVDGPTTATSVTDAPDGTTGATETTGSTSTDPAATDPATSPVETTAEPETESQVPQSPTPSPPDYIGGRNNNNSTGGGGDEAGLDTGMVAVIVLACLVIVGAGFVIYIKTKKGKMGTGSRPDDNIEMQGDRQANAAAAPPQPGVSPQRSGAYASGVQEPPPANAGPPPEKTVNEHEV